ncbi:MAG: hypothetical protein DBX59_01415 [Bacillota bacterium]|nr:MAG: hypothetical protein DBX59_01415 [Bacillota bacterium]
MESTKPGITGLDLRIVLSVMICYLTATMLDMLGIRFVYADMRLEIIQKMTACISCLLCCQDTTRISYKAGVNRIIITAIGGLVGILVVLLDGIIGNQLVMVVLVALGVLATLFLCKCAHVPYINARIGGVTFILVSSTLNGNARIWYAVWRLVSTLYGVAVVTLVTWGVLALCKKTDKAKAA